MGTCKQLKKQKLYKSSVRENIAAGKVFSGTKWIPEGQSNMSNKAYQFYLNGVVKGKRRKK